MSADTVTRYRCREEGELTTTRCRPDCTCWSQEYPKPSNEEGAGRAVTSAAGCTENPQSRERESR